MSENETKEEQKSTAPEHSAHGAHAKEAGAATAAMGTSQKVMIAVIAVVVAVAVACAGVFFAMNSNTATVGSLRLTLMDEKVIDESWPENPISWADYTSINDNVYAWIQVPNTNVDLPILQHPQAENYYLAHDIYGNDIINGAIYTQVTYNSQDFTADPLTVMYGHTFQNNDEMFSTLHNYEDKAFFDENPYFYIYTPDSILTYEVVSVYEGDNKLIPAKWDMTDDAKQQEYFDLVCDPTSITKNESNMYVRDVGRLEAGKDHIVQLSTCTKPSDANKRYLVTGVLRSVQPTKPKAAETAEAA